MKIVKMETHMLSQKVIANVTPEFARVYNIPEGHTSVGFFSADNDVDYVPRIGKYYQESLGLSEGTSIAYLVSAPVESMYGLDKALKAADVKIAELSEIPSRVNTGGAIVYGTESACRSAVEAFAEGVEYCAFHPMDIE